MPGCPAAVANLWDVTDRDIDRFAVDLLGQWLPDMEGDEGRRQAEVAGSHALCISASVTRSRGACRLPHLIGAAPVCYGIPTAVCQK
jgi:separase